MAPILAYSQPSLGLQQSWAALPLIQGGYYLLTGLWPLVHMDSFERVTVRKTGGASSSCSSAPSGGKRCNEARRVLPRSLVPR
ncbi:MAG: hypothetical protein WD273_02695 [Trueperaceae bacterium]